MEESKDGEELVRFDLRALRDGESQEWARLHVAARRAIEVYLVRKTTTEAAEELALETWFRAYRAAGRIPDDVDAIGWIVGFARNVLREYYREQARNQSRVRRLDGSERQQVDPDSEPGPEARARERREELVAVLTAAATRLPEERRLLLEWHYREGDSTARIAERLGTTAKAVEGRLARAREALRREAMKLDRELVSAWGRVAESGDPRGR